MIARICFKCNKDLNERIPPEHNDEIINPTYDGLDFGCKQFDAYGNYGSTVFDPFNGDRLVIFVCDECVTLNKELVYHVKHGKPVEETWDGQTC